MKMTLLFLAVMDLMKLHFIASYGFLIVGRPFPFLPASIAFFLALTLSRFLRRKGMRIVSFAFFETTAFVISFVAIYAAYKGEAFNLATILPRNDAELLPFLVVLASSAVFWIRAVWLETQKADHAFCATRFDEGIALFLMGFSIAALIRVENAFPGRLVIPYFIFGILALGNSKAESARRGGFFSEIAQRHGRLVGGRLRDRPRSASCFSSRPSPSRRGRSPRR